MLALSISSALTYKRRLAGMLVAVITGVAFLAGTLLLGDTLGRNFTQLFAQANSSTDVVLRSATELGSGVQGTRTAIPASLVERVQAVPGVADAQPYVQGYGQLVGRNGKAVGGNNAPHTAANWVSVASLNSYRLVSGRAPAADDEVVINRGAAKSGYLSLGETTTLLTPAPISVRIVGIATFGSADGYGTATFTGMTLAAARHDLTTTPSAVSEVLVKAAPGTSRSELVARLQPIVGSGVQAVTGDQVANENDSAINSGFLRFVRIALTVFALVALLVAALSIYNTFTIVSAQRVRESALLRALGASRPQLVATGAVEMLAVGLVGGVVGFGAGIGLAALLKGVFDAFGFALPAGGLVLRPSSALIAIGAGLATTLVAGLLPTIRAARVTPMAALRESAAEAPRLSRVRTAIAVSTLVLGLAAVFVGAYAGTGALVGLAGLLLVVSAVTGGPAVASRFGAVVGRPLTRLRGITGGLAAENVQRNPRRTAASALALVIGVAVIALFSVVGASLKASSTNGLDRSLRADIVVDVGGYGGTSGGSGLSPQITSAVASVPNVQLAAATNRGTVLLGGASHTVSAANLAQYGQVMNLDVRSGALRGADGIAVSQSAAQSHHWQVGSEVPVVFPDGAHVTVPVVAVYKSTNGPGDYLLAGALWTQHSSQPLVSQVLVQVRPGASVSATESAIVTVTQLFGAPRVQDRAHYISSVAASVNTILGLVYVMLVLAIVIALLGIANTISLGIHERRRELGLLRAIGQSRSQTRAMVRWESVLTALTGTLGGIVIGTVLGWALVRSSGSSLLAVFSLPVSQLVIFLVVGCLAGVLAGLRPAIRAARLNVLDAIAST